MQSAVARGHIRKNQRAKNGGGTFSPIRAREGNRVLRATAQSQFTVCAMWSGGPWLVACFKCSWKAAFERDELVAAHGSDYPMPDLLAYLAAPGCARLRSSWDRCGVYYVEPIEEAAEVDPPARKPGGARPAD
jgi:hypothetical protein